MNRKTEYIGKIEIPQYITKVMLSKKRRTEYYKKDGKHRIPSRFQPSPKFDNRGFLINPKTGEREIRNKKTAGKPRYFVISGNSFVSGFGSEFTRAKIVEGIKDFYRPFLYDFPVITTFPIRIAWDFYTTIGAANYDMSNFWFYYKYFEDCLRDRRELPDGSFKPAIIPDDNIKYVTQPGAPLLCPVEDFEDRKFVFRFYHDLRPEIQRNTLWKQQ